MPAPKKNEFWKMRSKSGRDKIFKTPEKLMEACNEYFQWCIDNPLYETIIQGGKEWIVPKMRAFTIKGLCIFLDIDEETFKLYCTEHKDFIGITTRVKDIIYTQKFEGSAAGFLNPNIIARDLGLKDKSELDNNVNLSGQIILKVDEDDLKV